ncbi:MAG: SDR family NAD(P)-dependent oxidoreductase [Proteobacteria bacterium]|nr:MAG: SDR family NAD(P)-dependent oxidoreductase [Pseudomonadota bacterium]
MAVWVNNAGIGTVGEFTETPLEAHVQVVKTNLLGYMNGCFAVLPYFKKQGSGTIINLNSLGAFVPLPFASGYSASKFGLLGFMEALRGELAADKNIHVCDIYPVSVNTPGYRHAGNYVGALLKPIPPMIDSETVAETVLDVVRSPRAQTTLGWPSAFARIGYALFPGLTRNLVGQMFREYFKIALPSPHTEGTIFESKRETGRTSGSPAASGAVFAKASHQNHKSELTTPLLVGAAGLAVGLGIFLALRQSKSSASKPLEKHADYPLYQRMQGSQIARG